MWQCGKDVEWSGGRTQGLRAKVKFMFYCKCKEKPLGGFKPEWDDIIGRRRGFFGALEDGL